MKMNIKCCIILAGILLLRIDTTGAQYIERYVISPAGKQLKGGDYAMQFTVGEPVTGTITHGDQLTQGFHQVWAVITATRDEASAESDIRVYPNPTMGSIHLETDTKGIVRLYDAMGRLLMERHLETGKNELNIADKVAGSYLLQITAERGDLMNAFLIQKMQ